MMKPLRSLLVAGVALTVVACGGQPAAPAGGAPPQATASEVATAVPTGAAEDHVAWFNGGVEAAFAQAKAENKPLFLYWGAVWCPPCYYLKNTVFQRPEVKAQIEKFIPVYLDGDDKSAQTWGEKFDVKGYPTVILFDPQGEEFMRMPSALEADRYAEVLAQALQDVRPVKDSYDAVMKAAAGEAKPADLKRLAYYAWDQDSKLALADADKLAAFKALLAKTPADMVAEKNRFFLLYLTEAINQHDSESKDPVFQPAERDELTAMFSQLLDAPELVRANFSDLEYMSREFVSALYPDKSPERDALVQRYLAVMKAAEDDTSLAYEQRVGAFYPAIELYRLENPPKGDEKVYPPAELQTRIKEKVAAFDREVTDKAVRQSLLSDLSWILQEAGLNPEAEAMLKAGMAQTEAPYYFMSDMADIAEQADRKTEAVDWYKKAYEATDANAEGGMTRFRWGYSYLRALVRLAPDDAATIEAEAKRVLGELLTHDDAFALGNKDRLNSLSTALLAWNKDGKQDATVQSLRAFVSAECAKFPADGEDSQQARCKSFLAPPEPTATPKP
jgi:thioredoxin-related protein